MTDPVSFTYFVLRVRAPAPGAPGAADSVAGIVERVGTAHKHSFEEGQELLRLLADWSQPLSKMPPAAATGNESSENRGIP